MRYEVFGLWSVLFPLVLVRTGRQGLSEGRLGVTVVVASERRGMGLHAKDFLGFMSLHLSRQS